MQEGNEDALYRVLQSFMGTLLFFKRCNRAEEIAAVERASDSLL